MAAAPKKNHVMLSYQWDSQVMVKKIYDELTNRGLKVWMDIAGDMKGNINAAMADGVEQAAVICPVMTQKYQDSRNCMKELNYADQCNIAFVPIMGQKNWKQSGMLGAILAGMLWVDFTNEDNFETSVNHLVKEIEHRYAAIKPTEKKLDELDIDGVVDLLKSLNLDAFSASFKDNQVDGKALVGLSDSDLEKELKMDKPLLRRKLLEHIANEKKKGQPVEVKEAKTEKKSSGGPYTLSNPPDSVKDCVTAGLCTFAHTKKEYHVQESWVCVTCGGDPDSDPEAAYTLCSVCITKCHDSHEVRKSTPVLQRVYCDCGARGLPDGAPRCACMPKFDDLVKYSDHEHKLKLVHEIGGEQAFTCGVCEYELNAKKEGGVYHCEPCEFTACVSCAYNLTDWDTGAEAGAEGEGEGEGEAEGEAEAEGEGEGDEGEAEEEE